MDRLDFLEVARGLIANGLDEAAAGHAHAVDVELTTDAVVVRDDGRGLPVHPHPVSGRRLLEVILTGARRGPQNTLARINGNCLWLEVEAHREGELWFQRFEFAHPVGPPQPRGAATRSGSSIRCAPAVGETPPFDDLLEAIRELAEVRGLRGVKVRVTDHRDGRQEELSFE